MGNMQSFNRVTGLTSNSILDIFSMARIREIEITISWDAAENSYRIELRKNNWRTIQYVSAEKLDGVATGDVRFMYYVLRKMMDSFEEVMKDESKRVHSGEC